MRYVHTNLISNNWRKLSEFYIEVFGCQVKPPVRLQLGDWLAKGTGVEKAQLQGVHLLLPGWGIDGPTLEIHEYSSVKAQPNVEPNKRGYGHIAFEVDNVTEVLDKIIRNGGTAQGEISRCNITGLGELTFVYTRDPEGNLIELQNWKK